MVTLSWKQKKLRQACRFIYSKIFLTFILLFFIVVLGFQLLSLFKIISTFAPDFSVYYHSAVNLIAQRNIYADSSLFTGLGYPPVTELLYIPFVVLPYDIAQSIFIIGSFGAFVLCVNLTLKLCHWYSWDRFIVVLTLGMLSFPTKFTFGMGQSNFYGLLFLLLSVFWIKFPWRSVVTLTLMLLAKPQLGIFLIPFVFMGKWKHVALALASYGGLTVVAGSFFRWDSFFTYITDMMPRLTFFSGREMYYNQGLSAFFSRLMPSLAWYLTIIGSGAVIIFGTLRLKKAHTIVEGLVIFAPLYLLLEPLAWQHHMVFLLPTFVFFWKQFKDWWLLLLLMCSYLLVSGNIKSPEFFTGLPGAALILSHGFFGIVLLFILGLNTIGKKKTIKT